MAADLTLKVGNRLPALVLIARDNVGPVDLAGATATFRMVNVLTGETKIDNAPATIGTQPTFTVDAATNVLNSPGHNLNNGEAVTTMSDGASPGGLTTQTQYFVINATASTLQLSLNVDGSAVDITDAGSGTHTLLPGRVSYDWQSADVDQAGTYFAQIDTVVGGKTLTYPNDSQLKIEIVSNLADASDRTKAIKAVIDRTRPDVEPTLTQGEIELEVDRAQLVRVWQSNTAYKYNDVIVPVERNGHCYVCIQPGTSKSGSYRYFDWPIDAGYQFGDGNSDPALVWEECGTDRFNGAVFGLETNIYDISRAARECWLLKARYCSQFIDDGELRFTDIRKSCLAHASEFRPFQRQAQLVRIG